MRTQRTIVGIILAAMLLFAGHASTLTYYVATTGNDARAGTATQPWLTIQKAADTASPGDTVVVRGGVYAEQVTFRNSGRAGTPITFQCAPESPAIIDGASLGIGQWDSLVEIAGAQYLTLSGFEIRNSGYWNVFISGEATHLRLENLDVHDASQTQVLVSGPRTHPALSTISGCKIHDGPSGGICLYWATGGYWLIEGNEVYGNDGADNYDGVQVGSGDAGAHHVVVKNNVIHDNALSGGGADNLDLGGHGLSHHYLVEGNDVYGGGGSFKLHSGLSYTPGVSSFHIARFNCFTGIGYDCYGFPDPVVIYNNTFVDAGQAVQFYGQSGAVLQNLGDTTYAGGDTGRMNWKNNIIYQESPSAAYALLCNGRSIDVSYKSVRFQHTLYEFSPGQQIAWTAQFYAPIGAKVFATFQSSNAPYFPDTGSILTTATPQQTFVNYAARDYRLVRGSPAIDKGMPLTVATNAGRRSTTLKVDRASYFQDGYPVNGEYLNTPDSIVIGKNAPVAIVSVDDANNVIVLKSPMTWAKGDSATLAYQGIAPDIGAFEYGL